MSVKYSYTKGVASDRLTKEINESSIVTSLDYIQGTSLTTEVYFKSTLSPQDEATLTQIVSDHIALPLPESPPPQNVEKVPLFEPVLRRGKPGTDSLTVITHDFTDRTTWYQEARELTRLSLAEVSGTVFQAPVGDRFWVNIDSPRLTYDHKKVFQRDGTFRDESDYLVEVRVNDNLVDPSDYTVNFLDGSITFNSDQSGNVVQVDCFSNDSVANPSQFLLTPTPGKTFRIEHVELQFSKNLVFNNPIMFEVWAGSVNPNGTPNLDGYMDFHPMAYDAGYGQQRSTYRSHRDLINWCNNQYPLIPACGGMQDDVLVFPFLFLVAVDVVPYYGITIRTVLKDHIPLLGEIATCTFYMETIQL